MLKKIFIISCALLNFSISFDSCAYPDSGGPEGMGVPERAATSKQQKACQEAISKSYQEALGISYREIRRRNEDLADAERSCNVNVYSAALQKYITSPRVFHPDFRYMPIVPDLQGIMNKCYKSGSLNALVQTNINAGGDPKRGERYTGRLCDRSFLGTLAAQRMQGLSSEQTADVSSTVDTLVKAGCNINTGLVEAAFHGNMPFVQILLKKGGNIYRPIYPCYAGNLSALGALSWGKIRLMTLQAQVSFRKRHANLEDL